MCMCKQTAEDHQLREERLQLKREGDNNQLKKKNKNTTLEEIGITETTWKLSSELELLSVLITFHLPHLQSILHTCTGIKPYKLFYSWV